MRAFLAENLRLHSPIAAFARTAHHAGTVPPDADTGIGAFAYPAGAVFLCSVIGAHFDPKRWPEPTALRPERYLEGVDPSLLLVAQGQAVRRAIRAREENFDLLPFGAGPGRCAGQPFAHHESIMVLDALLSRYRFELSDPGREVKLTQVVVLAPEKGALSARIRRRAA